MSNKIPTAEEYIINQGFATWAVQDSPDTTEVVINYQDCLQAMEEFAKLHVEAALQAAAEKAKVYIDSHGDWISSNTEAKVSKQSILNAYSLNNIK